MGRLRFIQQTSLILVFLSGCFGLSALAAGGGAAGIKEPRLRNAQELLGGSFRKVVVRKGRTDIEISEFVAETTRRFLPKKEKKRSVEISNAIVNAAEEFDLDPVFLMAVIQNESSFRPSKVGTIGEIGLMQILPESAGWIAGLYSLEYQGPKSLYSPETNVWIGAALLDRLRHQFDSNGRHYLSAYNLGPGKLRSMISEKRIPSAYYNSVLKRYRALYAGYKAKGDVEFLSQTAVRNVMKVTN